MAKPNYSGEKRRKEQEKQKKKAEKKRRKLENASGPSSNDVLTGDEAQSAADSSLQPDATQPPTRPSEPPEL